MSIVIVSYNVKDRLRACLDSVRKASGESGLSVETVVVDNASGDGSADMVEAEFPGTAVLRSRDNEGYGTACNRGAAASTGAVLLFLNADVELLEGSVRELWEALQGRERVGLAGPALRDTKGCLQNSVRCFPSPGVWLLDGTIFERWRVTGWMLSGYKPVHPSGAPAEVDWLEGACLAVRRDAFQEIGGFDSRYFMYCEELDLSRRLRDGDWQRMYVPGATATHHGGESARQHAARSRALFLRSKVQYAARTWGGVAAIVAAGFYGIALGLELGLELGKLLLPAGDRAGRVRSARTLWRCLGLFVRGASPGA